MITITLPDGKTKSFDKPVSGLEVAQSIGAGLAKAALAIKVDGEVRDLAHVIDRDAKVALITAPKPGQPWSDEALKLMRHSAAHVMAEAIQDVVGKDVQLAYGPPTDTGFFYDMYVPEGKKLSSDLFEKIDKRMAEIVKEDRKFCREDRPAQAAISQLDQERNKYKVDNAKRALDAMIADGGKVVGQLTLSETRPQLPGPPFTVRFPEGATLSFYATGTSGQNWEDLCRGPHVPSTGRIGAIKVMSLASAFWHGDENSDRLTRVYGTAFGSQAELDAYLAQLAAAKERDHREIGKKLRLFHIDEDVGQGLILWTPHGSIIRKELQTFIGAELKKQGYTEVFTPHIGRLELYKTSGHFPYYKDSQFPPIVERNAPRGTLQAGGAPAPRCSTASRASPRASPRASTSAPRLRPSPPTASWPTTSSSKASCSNP